jgi:hypothetical protein
MKRIRWTNQENQLLRDNYFDCELSELLHLLPERTWNSIKIQARKLGLNRDNIGRTGDLSFLLEENLEAYYWMGFLMADGHFQSRGKMNFALAKKDEERVRALAKKLKANVHENKNSFTIGIMHKDACEKIVEKFLISNNKTHNPPKTITQSTEEKTIAFIIGFIDGDGCIKKQTNRNDAVIHIKLHKTWEPILIEIETFLFKHFNVNHNKVLTKINNSGYSSLVLSNGRIVRGLKKFIQENKLSVLERKWDRIDENQIQKLSIDEQRIRVYDYISKHPSAKRKEICKSLEFSESYLVKLLKA